MAIINVAAEVKGSSNTSVKPTKIMSVSVSLSGKASAGPKGKPSTDSSESK